MTDGTPAHSTAIARLKALVDRLRPPAAQDAEQRVRAEAARLGTRPDEAAALGEALRSLLALPRQGAFYAETGVTSAQGFWLELAQRLRERLLPPLRDESRLRSILHLLFADRDDHLWVTAVADDAWLELVAALGLKIKNGCSYHGLSLNVDMDLSPFAAINPCGYAGLKVIQTKDLNVPLTPFEAGEQLSQHLLVQLDKQHG